MATLSLKSFQKEQHSVIPWAKGLSANAIHSVMHPVYGDRYLQDHQYMFGVKSLLMVEKVG